MRLTVTGTGDSLFVAPFPKNYQDDLSDISKYIQSCDVKITNLETNFSDFEYFGNAYSGGTWINTKREYIQYIKKYGFDYYGNANNHAMDYGHNGLLSTLEVLDDNDLLHSGTGKSLKEASKPAIFITNGQKIAIIAVDTSFADASRAGNETAELSPRPGVNYLGHNDYYYVTEHEMQGLKSIAKATHINFARELAINTGFSTPDKPGHFVFGGNTFTTDKNMPSSDCNRMDLNRILCDIKKAKAENDYVFILVHCHGDDNVSHANPPEYLKEFCHKAIDSGVSAIFGGGCHELRGIEVYKNCPIFYSLGDFIYQGLRVECLPADFMEKYGVDIHATAKEALFARSRNNTVGLHLMKENYQSILPKIEFEDGVMTRLALLPIDLNFDAKDDRNGLPRIAKGNEQKEVVDKIVALSECFGTELSLQNGELIYQGK